MSSTKPQDYDPYLDSLQNYEKRVDKLLKLLESKKDKIASGDYNNLITDVNSLLFNLQKDIEVRTKQKRPRPPYIS